MRLVPGKVPGDELPESSFRMILGVVELWFFLIPDIIREGLETAACASENSLFWITLSFGVNLPNLTICVDLFTTDPGSPGGSACKKVKKKLDEIKRV